MKAFDVVIVGGGYAGLTAAGTLARSRPSVRVLLIDAKHEFVERIRLHEVAAGVEPKTYPYSAYLRKFGATFLQGSVEDILLGDSMLRVRVSHGEDAEIGYRYLILALGSRTDRSQAPGISDHAFCLDSVSEATQLAHWAQSSQGKLLVVGGALTAFETATEFAERCPRLDVTLVSAGKLSASHRPGGFSDEAVRHFRSVFHRLNIRFLENSPI